MILLCFIGVVLVFVTHYYFDLFPNIAMAIKDWIQWFRSIFFRKTAQAPPIFTVLVIGASGVGKSTLLNFIHYMQHCSTFDKAVNTKVDLLLPVEIDEKDRETYMAKFGTNENINNKGHSCTQRPMDHMVDYGRFKIHYVDTPGTNDTRGTEQDEANVKLIVDHLTELPEVHSILFVVKNNESTLGATFENSMHLLLQMLPRKALKNCCFVYTFSEPMKFKPGRMSTTLKAFAAKFNELHGMNDLYFIVANNQFYVDNVAFNTMLALQNGKSVSSAEVEKAKLSWDTSKKNIDRFIQHTSFIDPISQTDFKLTSVMQKLGKVMRERGYFKTSDLDLDQRRLMASISDWAVTSEAILCQRQKGDAVALRNDEWEQAAEEWKAKDDEIGELVEDIALIMAGW